MAKSPKSRPESNRICNVLPSHDTDSDWGFSSALAAGSLMAGAAPPPSVDLRATWWPVGDQKDTGSCVGWGSTDGVARYHFTQAGRLAQGAELSIRFTWMASKETDAIVSRPETMIEGAGTTLKAAMDILRKYGAVPADLLPFQITNYMYRGNENDFFATAATRKVAAYYNLKKNFAQWRAWLAGNGPLLVALNVDETWDRAASTQGILDTYKPATARGGHAVAVVGYRTDGRFILRNSWGKPWGDAGFGYASEAYISAAFFEESYGVSL